MKNITIFSIWNKTYYLCSVVYKHFNIITGQVTAKASALLFDNVQDMPMATRTWKRSMSMTISMMATMMLSMKSNIKDTIRRWSTLLA